MAEMVRGSVGELPPERLLLQEIDGLIAEPPPGFTRVPSVCGHSRPDEAIASKELISGQRIPAYGLERWYYGDGARAKVWLIDNPLSDGRPTQREYFMNGCWQVTRFLLAYPRCEVVLASAAERIASVSPDEENRWYLEGLDAVMLSAAKKYVAELRPQMLDKGTPIGSAGILDLLKEVQKLRPETVV